MGTIFQLKDKPLHSSCKIYKGKCSCGESYVGETTRTVEMRWIEHNAPLDKSNATKHLNENITHSWKSFVMHKKGNLYAKYWEHTS